MRRLVAGRLFSRTLVSGVHRLNTFKIERFPGWFDKSDSLSSSECEPINLAEVLSYADSEARRDWESLSLGYPDPSEGDPKLREAIVRAHYTAAIDPLQDTNIVTPQEGIFLASAAMLQPGDHVVATTPCYQSLTEVAKSIGCTVSAWRPEGLEPNGVARFDPAMLERLLRPNTTAVIANWPHNPTGALPTPDEFDRVLELCDARKCHLFVDEMYAGLEHGGRPRLPPACVVYDRGVTLGGVSKSLGLPGLRIGWLASRNKALMQRVSELKDYTTIVPAAPSMALATIALTTGFEPLLARSRGIIGRGLADAREFAAAHASAGVEWCEPSGGTFSFVRLQGLGEGGATAYTDSLRQRRQLMLIPSSLFEETEDDRIRLCFGFGRTSQLLERWADDLRSHGLRP